MTPSLAPDSSWEAARDGSGPWTLPPIWMTWSEFPTTSSRLWCLGRTSGWVGVSRYWPTWISPAEKQGTFSSRSFGPISDPLTTHWFKHNSPGEQAAAGSSMGPPGQSVPSAMHLACRHTARSRHLLFTSAAFSGINKEVKLISPTKAHLSLRSGYYV